MTVVSRSAFQQELHQLRLQVELMAAAALAAGDQVDAIFVWRAIERIAHHTVTVGERLRYLLTGDPVNLASEVR